jgi:hypothetical protein
MNRHPMMFRNVLKAAAAVMLSAHMLSACTFVHMAPGASAVKVVDGQPDACEKRGEVEVSVKDSIAFYERNHLRVREELETLARNEAPGLNADTIQPIAPPQDGAQRFIAWRCRR